MRWSARKRSRKRWWTRARIMCSDSMATSGAARTVQELESRFGVTLLVRTGISGKQGVLVPGPWFSTHARITADVGDPSSLLPRAEPAMRNTRSNVPFNLPGFPGSITAVLQAFRLRCHAAWRDVLPRSMAAAFQAIRLRPDAVRRVALSGSMAAVLSMC
jgi:hypothetical protein